jgi:hypothetical protein
VLIAIFQFLSCEIAAAGAPSEMHFDGNRSFSYLEAQVNSGPRLPNYPGLEKTRGLIKSTLGANGFEIGSQPFMGKSQLLGQEFQGINLYGIYPKGAKVKYFISAHYDTRPVADEDPDPALRHQPILGANDGGSGVAVLLEMSNWIPKMKLPYGVALVFYDLEDHGLAQNDEGFCLGSEYMATHLPPELKFEQGVNLDMVGDKSLELPMEGFSLQAFPDLTQKLWAVGEKLHSKAWQGESGRAITDDHMPFLKRGEPFIDVIDFDYPAWHTTADTADKCSSKSLEIVGDTMLHFIQN